MTGHQDLTPAKVKEQGWRQGSIVPESLARILQTDGHVPSDVTFDPTADLLLVISQDCDVVNSSFSSEPWCEVFVLRRVPKIDGNFARGKNPRKIHFGVPELGPVACSVHDKFRFPRQYLAVSTPSEEIVLSRDMLRMLRDWIVKRYVRAAFPDAFNKRWDPEKSRITRTLSSKGAHLEEVFLIINTTEELPPEEPYEVFLVGAMLDEDYDDEAKFEAADAALREVADELERCAGIEAGGYTARPRRDISLSDLDQMLRWDYWDNLSVSTE